MIEQMDSILSNIAIWSACLIFAFAFAGPTFIPNGAGLELNAILESSRAAFRFSEIGMDLVSVEEVMQVSSSLRIIVIMPDGRGHASVAVIFIANEPAFCLLVSGP